MSRLLRDAAQAKAETRGDLLRAVAGMAPDPARQAEPEPEKSRRTSLDGGARQSIPQPESHEQTLAKILAERRADVGRSFGA